MKRGAMLFDDYDDRISVALYSRELTQWLLQFMMYCAAGNLLCGLLMFEGCD